MALVFDTCCCCIDLRTGSFIIGYLNLIGSLIVMALEIVILLFSDELNITRTTSEKEAAYIIFVVACVMMILLAVALTFAIVLVIGLHQEKRGHVKAFLIYDTIIIILSIIQFLAFIILLPMTVWTVIIHTVSIVLNTYYLLCLRSYYLRMGDFSKRPTIYNINSA